MDSERPHPLNLSDHAASSVLEEWVLSEEDCHLNTDSDLDEFVNIRMEVTQSHSDNERSPSDTELEEKETKYAEMSIPMRGRGLQVVDVTSDHKYELKETVLADVLSRVKDLPVMVVSVAGAYRGGKSFLLSFFLRYLNASDADRRSGRWIGRDDEPLEGFEWSTGDTRNTIGIHIWSEPYVFTLPGRGGRVAVVLMDTQGTFDDQSTMRDCTTIFALCTLLSSVLIYNVKSNLNEYDLQHLELFTEYSKLVITDAGTPFQHLKFLVRDWMFKTHPCGAEGGKALLDTKLQVKANQPTELREVRERINSCFEDISCYLMAHPGFSVEDDTFVGTLGDLRPEFKKCLLELVPLVLSKMVPKRIGRERVTAGQLLLCFRTYMNTITSEDMPTPTTLRQATESAGLLLAEEAARAAYAAEMRKCGESAQPANALYRHHANATAAVRRYLAGKKIMTNHRKMAEVQEKLMQDFDNEYQQYTTLNEAKIMKAFKDANQKYEEEMLAGGDLTLLCRNPEGLEEDHQTAMSAAIAFFHSKMTMLPGYEDKETPFLQKDIKERYRQMVRMNEINNQSALAEALETYGEHMETNTSGQTCLSTSQLSSVHNSACAAAEALFRSKRQDLNLAEDKFITELKKDMKNQYNMFKKLNNSNTESARVGVVATYSASMWQLLRSKCLTSSEFDQEEDRIREQALNKYSIDIDSSPDIITAINQYCDQMKEQNDNMNKTAVQSACSEYRAVMGAIPLYEVEEHHDAASQVAIDHFKLFRRNQRVNRTGDFHYDNLQKELQRLLQQYKDKAEQKRKDDSCNIL